MQDGGCERAAGGGVHHGLVRPLVQERCHWIVSTIHHHQHRRRISLPKVEPANKRIDDVIPLSGAHQAFLI